MTARSKSGSTCWPERMPSPMRRNIWATLNPGPWGTSGGTQVSLFGDGQFLEGVFVLPGTEKAGLGDLGIAFGGGCECAFGAVDFHSPAAGVPGDVCDGGGDGSAVGESAANEDVVRGGDGDVGLSVGDETMLELGGDVGRDFFEVADAEGEGIQGVTAADGEGVGTVGVFGFPDVGGFEVDSACGEEGHTAAEDLADVAFLEEFLETEEDWVALGLQTNHGADVFGRGGGVHSLRLRRGFCRGAIRRRRACRRRGRP